MTMPWNPSGALTEFAQPPAAVEAGRLGRRDATSGDKNGDPIQEAFYERVIVIMRLDRSGLRRPKPGRR
jgi:hypothetical protein